MELLDFLWMFLGLIVLFSIGFLKKYSFKANVLMKRLRKTTNMGVLLLSHDIDFKAMNKVEKILVKAEKKGIKEIILILNTFGGYEFAMSRITKSITTFNGKIHCYVPKYSMSAGTFIALSCSSLHMGKKSSLGGVDTQIGNLFWVYSSRAWQEVVRKKGAKADDNSIIMSLYAKQYSKLMREQLDKLPMLKKFGNFKKFISDGNIPHSQQLDIDLLKKFGLKILPIEYDEINEIALSNPNCIKAVL